MASPTLSHGSNPYGVSAACVCSVVKRVFTLPLWKYKGGRATPGTTGGIP